MVRKGPATAPRTRRQSWALWTAYGAAVWSVLFGGLSFFWAAGGVTGLQPLEQTGAASPTTAILARLVNVFVGLVKVFAAFVIVAYARETPLPVSRRLLTGLVWFAGVGMLVYGSVGEVSDILHVTGVVYDPTTVHWFFDYLVLWDPWWALGGALVTATAWLMRRGDSAQSGRLEQTH